MTLPDYVNCKNKVFQDCDYLLTRDCPNTCVFAQEIGGIGFSAPVLPRQSDNGIDTDVSDSFLKCS